MKKIQITVDPRENFTPAGLMKRYADRTAGVAFGSSLFGNAELTIEGRRYQYHHWGITANEGQCCVTLFLLDVGEAQQLNNMCRCCIRLHQDCKGTSCQTWTGCVRRRAEA